MTNNNNNNNIENENSNDNNNNVNDIYNTNDQLDEDIVKIMKKAERIVQKELKLENLQTKRIEKLTAFREEDGRLKTKIKEIKTDIKVKTSNIQRAKRIRKENFLYLSILEKFKQNPLELQNQLKNQIEDYDWAKYSKIQDELYDLTNDKNEETLQKEIQELKNEETELESIRSHLVDEAIEILYSLSLELEKIESS